MVHQYLAEDIAPMHLIAGPNESGKSSIADAIAFALTGELRRLKAKGERGLLVSQGKQKGNVALHVETRAGSVILSKDVRTGKAKVSGTFEADPGADTAIMPYLVNPHAFLAASPLDRRTTLLKVMKISLSAQNLRAELKSRLHAPALVDQLPGEETEGWQEFCRDKASEERGAWKAVTGETYGDVKGAEWVSPQPITEAASEEEIEQVSQTIRNLIAQRDQFAATVAVQQERESQIRDLTNRRNEASLVAGDRDKAAARVEAARKREQDAQAALLADRKTLADLQQQGIAGPPRLACVNCGALHILTTANMLEAAPPAPANPVDITDIANAQTVVGTSMAAAKTAATALQAATAAHEAIVRSAASLEEIDRSLATLVAPGEPVDVSQLSILDEKISQKRDFLAAMMAANGDAERGAAQTDRAREHHGLVQSWVKLSEAVSPNGIIAEMLGKGLKAFNDTLAKVSIDLGFQPPSLGADMAATRGGLPYELLSRSAGWRVDVAIAISLAIFSNMRFVVLDEFDLLSIPNRTPMLAALYGMVTAGTLDTAIVMGTLKELPKMPPAVGKTWLG